MPSAPLLVYLGSGGHTTEMMLLLAEVEDVLKKVPVVFTCSDDRSERMAKEWISMRGSASSSLHRLYRARAVKQSYITSIVTSLVSFFHCLYVILFYVGNPRLLFINGPGTSLILLFAVRCVNFLSLSLTPVVYAESVCRVKKWSLTGKLVGLGGWVKRCKMWNELEGGESIEGVLFNT
ncbi:hypothetical protein TrCOL_g4849 [Triparma columacea]|uniref:UDP-N-acetylglucosamine transferase subunit ALG14 n=1 Tax=Triparma columacea TaxID=722753 RepID=A0A9W7GLH4_9STRA|nr:hypothetical protein TrCOL_g4849 [Triparma columacea]